MYHLIQMKTNSVSVLEMPPTTYANARVECSTTLSAYAVRLYLFALSVAKPSALTRRRCIILWMSDDYVVGMLLDTEESTGTRDVQPSKSFARLVVNITDAGTVEVMTMTRATTEVCNIFGLRSSQFGSLRHVLTQKLIWRKPKLLPDEKCHGLRWPRDTTRIVQSR